MEFYFATICLSVCLSVSSLPKKLLMNFWKVGECGWEKSGLNFGTDPAHILDMMDIVNLPVGYKCCHSATAEHLQWFGNVYIRF